MAESNGGVISQFQKLDEDGLDTTSQFYEERKKIEQSKPHYYSNKLETDYDRIKADTNKDGLISKDEYENYIILKTETKEQSDEPKTIVAAPEKSNFDTTTILSVSIICITSIIICFLILRFRNRNTLNTKS